MSTDSFEDWHLQLRNRITKAEELEKYIELTTDERRAIAKINEMTIDAEKKKINENVIMGFAITPYTASLMDKSDEECPIRKQFIPTIEEFKTHYSDMADPCGEDKDMKVPRLVHRYPDRVLFIATDACASYCRFCTRKRIVGLERSLSNEELHNAAEYIKNNKEIRDVLISGGDPSTFSDSRLEQIIKTFREIEHVKIIRLGLRTPSVMPQRITPEFCEMLKKYHPLYINIHFNHPKEISEETRKACNMLVDAGIPLGSQTVLLKGINDSPKIIMELMHKLLEIRVKPYYLYQCDLAKGTYHFRTSVDCGERIMRALRGYTGGLAVPTYVIDSPGGGGKVPMQPDYVISKSRRGVIFKNYEGKVFVYPQNGNGFDAEEIRKINGKFNKEKIEEKVAEKTREKVYV